MTLAVSYVFFRHRSTPVIKASGRELSAILLVATLCSFAMTFLIASRPSPTKCGITRFMLGLTHTLAFAAIAVKTNRYSSDHKNTFPFSCSQFPLHGAFYTLLTRAVTRLASAHGRIGPTAPFKWPFSKMGASRRPFLLFFGLRPWVGPIRPIWV